VSHANVPALLHRDLDHLVQLRIADVAFRIHAMDGCHQLAQAASRQTRPGGNGLRGIFDFAHQAAGDALVDRLLRIEEAIDIRRTHSQHLGDVGDGGLLIADLAKQAQRHLEDSFSGVGFDVF